MAFREKKVTLDRHNDAVTINWADVSYDGTLEMEIVVWRELKSGTAEQTTFVAKLDPEEAVCAIRTLKRAVQGSRNKMLERVQELGAEL